MQALALPRVEPALVALDNVVVGRRRVLDVALGAQRFQLKFHPAARDVAVERYATLRVGNSRMAVGLSRLDALETLRGLLAGAELAALDPAWQPLVVEAACAPLFKALGHLTGSRVAVEAVVEGSERPPGEVTWSFEAHAAEERIAGLVILDRPLAEQLAKRIEQLPFGVAWDASTVPLVGQLLLGGTELTLAELNSLRPHDIILFDWTYGPTSEHLCVRFGPGALWLARATSGLVTLEKPMSPTSTPPEGNPAGKPVTVTASDNPALDTGEWPVVVQFDLGTLERPLGELTSLQAGYTFELPVAAARPVTIRVNGRAIGTGELVQIGDRLGVRLVETPRP